MRVSIIIPALNEERVIRTMLDAVKKLGGEKEIIVVDGASIDNTVEYAQSCGISVITAERGRGQQMRAGAQHSVGDVLWFLHADTIPPPNALYEIVAALANPLVAGGNFGLLFEGPSRSARQLTAIYPWLRMLRLSYGDSGIFVRREAYERFGGIQPVALFEDLDLVRRIRKMGHFVHLDSRITASSRRFERKNFALVWAHWTTLQVLYWFGVPPDWLARWYYRDLLSKRNS